MTNSVQTDNAQAKTPTFAAFHFDPNAQIEEAEAIFERLLKRRQIVVWLAREKAGKSTLLLQMCMCAAAGRDFLNFRFAASTPLKIVMIDYESTDSVLKKRYESILKDLAFSNHDRQFVEQNLTILLVRNIRAAGKAFPPLPLPGGSKTIEKSESRNFWKDLPAHYPADMYCIDPLRSAHEGEENDSKIGGLMESFQTLFKGKTVIMPHHLKKRDPKSLKDVKAIKQDIRDFSERGRGSAAIKAHADVIICQARGVDSKKDDEAVYWGAFGRDMEDILAMRLEAVSEESFAFKVAPELLDGELGEHWDIVREHFQPHQTFTKAEFVHALTKADVKRATAYRRFSAFQNRGLIIQAAAGTYGFARTVRQRVEDINNKEDNFLSSDETRVDR